MNCLEVQMISAPLKMREEQLIDFKRELEDTRKTLLSSDMEEEELLGLQSTLQELIFESSLKVKKLLHSHIECPSSIGQGIKLPKLDVPTFDTLLHVDGTNVSVPVFNPPLNPTTDPIPSHVVMR